MLRLPLGAAREGPACCLLCAAGRRPNRALAVRLRLARPCTHPAAPAAPLPRPQGGHALLKDQLELVKVRQPDGATRYTIKPLESEFSFDKGFFMFVRAIQLLMQHNKDTILVRWVAVLGGGQGCSVAGGCGSRCPGCLHAATGEGIPPNQLLPTPASPAPHHCAPRPPTQVGLAGPSGSGKTAFSAKIKSFIPGCALLSMDNYNDGSKVIDGNFDGARWGVVVGCAVCKREAAVGSEADVVWGGWGGS